VIVGGHENKLKIKDGASSLNLKLEFQWLTMRSTSEVKSQAQLESSNKKLLCNNLIQIVVP
jgi:hypothetical protein